MHRLPPVIRPDSPRPRVLLVDDHRGILDRVAALLDQDFEVAGVATDGRQAVDAARRLAPDLIVLDINMPGLDGFQTKRALDQAGSRAPVVFLSAVDDDLHVSEAFRCGARGYVMKPLMAQDLASAIDQVLLGRLFAPSLTSLLELTDGSGHAVQLHGDLDAFLDGLAAFFDHALRRGDATCVIATDEVREGLSRRLSVAGWNVGGPSGHERYLVLSAADAARRVMRNGLPEPGVVGEIAAELDQYRRAVSGRTPSRLTMFGNVSTWLIADGNTAAALALEREWNRQTSRLPIFTLCGYSTSCFHDQTADLWSHTCQEHWAVSHTRNL